MVIDKIIVEKKLNHLKHEVGKIEGMDFTMDQILDDEDVQDMLDRRMEKAIESCIDIATHLVAGLELPRQDRAADIFLLLGKNNIISKETANKFSKVVGFRNILVHEYADIDYELAYSDLEEKLKDLKDFARQVLRFLEKQR